jgi:hypothetical protein
VGLKGLPEDICIDVDAVARAVQYIRYLAGGPNVGPPASVIALSIAIAMHASHYLVAVETPYR